MPDLDQHRCNRTVYSRSGATPLLRDCVRVNSFGTGSQHVQDLEQHPYHMLLNSFVRCDNPDLKQHRCYGTGYGSIRFIMYYDDFCFFAALPSSFSTWHRLHSTLGIAFILQKMYCKPDIYILLILTLMYIFLSRPWVPASPMRSSCVYI